MVSPRMFDDDHYERLEALHAVVQANKLTPYGERGPERWVAHAAAKDLRETLDDMVIPMLDASSSALERGDEDGALAILKEVSELKRFKTFKTLWDVRNE